MEDRTFTLLERARSPLGANWKFWIPVILFWCLNSALVLSAAQAENVIAPAVLSNAVSAVCLTIFIFIWQKIIDFRGKKPTPLPWVLGAGILLGTLKGTSTYLVFFALTETPFTAMSLFSNVIAAISIGFWLLPTINIIASLLEEFERERTELISEIVFRKQESLPDQDSDREVAEFIAHARKQISANLHSEEDFQQVLTNLAENGARSTSHKLWRGQEQRLDFFNLNVLILSTLRRHNFPSIFISVFLFVALFSAQFNKLGLVASVAISIAQATIAWVFFFIGKHIPLRGQISGPIIFLVTPLLSVLAIDLFSRFTTGQMFGEESWKLDILLFLGLLFTSVIIGAAFEAKSSHERIRAELSTLRAENLESKAQEIVNKIRRRETAELLHGYVQNQLVTSAALVGNKTLSVTETAELVEQMLSQLERGTLNLYTNEIEDLSQLLDSHKKTWEGVLDINWEIDGKPCVEAPEMQLLDQVINELASNSYRHGLAQECSIRITLTSNHIELEVSDDGVGPRDGKPGLGTALISSASDGQWSRMRREDQLGTKVDLVITRKS